MKTPTQPNGEERKEPAYPYYDLENAIKFAEVVKDLGGSREGVKKSLLAKQLGIAESTPSFFQKLSATKVFGIIQGWGSYGLTEVGRKYFYPDSEQARRDALLKIFSTPRAFSFLLSRFDGEKLPTSEIMGNVVHQEVGVTDSWKDRVAQTFVRSANFAGIIDTNGFLRYSAEMHSNPAQADSPRGEFRSIPSPIQRITQEVVPPTKVSPPDRGVNVWQFGQIRLETPESLSPELWQKLNKYVEILKPLESEAGK